MAAGTGTSEDDARTTILVVDDDADQRACLAELLGAAGYRVVVAGDGGEALDRLRDGLRPALIVLDLTMPGMDGWSFLEHLRGAARSTVPVLVTSAVAREHPPPGADARLEKPLDSAVFKGVVERLVARAPDGARVS